MTIDILSLSKENMEYDLKILEKALEARIKTLKELAETASTPVSKLIYQEKLLVAQEDLMICRHILIGMKNYLIDFMESLKSPELKE